MIASTNESPAALLPEGRRLALARDYFFDSVTGRTISNGKASGAYLRNRIELAFIAGWEAGRKDSSTSCSASDTVPIYLLYTGARFAKRTTDAKAALAHFNGGVSKVIILAEDHMYQAQRESDFPSAAHAKE